MLKRTLASPQAGLVLVILFLGGVLGAFAGSHVDARTGLTVNNFLNSYTLIQTATDASFFAIMAVGATMVIISGGIDLSVGSIYALAGVTTAMVLRSAGPLDPLTMIALGLTVSLGIGLLCGAINGALVVGLGVHPFIITLGTMWIVRGIAFVTSNAESILLPRALTSVAKASLGLREALYPVPMIVMVAVAVVGGIYLMHTVGGPARVRGRRQHRSEPLLGCADRSREDRGVRALGAHRWSGGVHGRELLRLGVVRGRDGLRALRDCLGRRRRREPVGRQGECRGSTARCGAHRAHPAVDSDAALRPELRVDHHRMRDYHRSGARSGQRPVHRTAPLCSREVGCCREEGTQQSVRPERGAKSPRESERSSPASIEKC